MTDMERGYTPENLDEMPGEFYELEQIRIAEWGPARDGQGPQTQVHLLAELAGLPLGRGDQPVARTPLVFRFKGPDTLAAILTALTGHGLSVFGQALAEKLRATEAQWRAQ